MWLISHISLNILGLGKFVGHLNNSPIDQPNGKKLNEASERERKKLRGSVISMLNPCSDNIFAQ